VAQAVAMLGGGHSCRYVARKLGCSHTAVENIGKRYPTEISNLRVTVRAETIDDYNRIIRKLLTELESRLDNPAEREKWDARDLVRGHQVMFDKRQLLAREPNIIVGKAEGDDELDALDRMAIQKAAFEENMLTASMEDEDEVIDGEVVE
jgi:hypothetical protein